MHGGDKTVEFVTRFQKSYGVRFEQDKHQRKGI